MSNPPRSEEAGPEPVQELWVLSSRFLKKRGYDIDRLLGEWTESQLEKLTSPGARTDFGELTADGCVREVLAVLLALLRWSPNIEEFWGKVYGSSAGRRRTRRALTKAAAALEELFSFPISLEDEVIGTKFDEIGHLTPARLASELKLYASSLDLLDRFPRETKTRSFADFLRFVLADYVKAATGRFRDRNVSGLLAEILGPTDYNEVAQRMWRHRNYGRMKKHYPLLSELLQNVGRVLVNRT
jgi:hypothetical protein